MSSFTKAIVEIDDTQDPCVFKLTQDMEYHQGSIPSETVFTVPSGYITDLASVPKLLWFVFPPQGRYAKAAILHDYLYSIGAMSRKAADYILVEAMKVLEVPAWKRISFYLAVRLFGRSHYYKKVI